MIFSRILRISSGHGEASLHEVVFRGAGIREENEDYVYESVGLHA